MFKWKDKTAYFGMVEYSWALIGAIPGQSSWEELADVTGADLSEEGMDLWPFTLPFVSALFLAIFVLKSFEFLFKLFLVFTGERFLLSIIGAFSATSFAFATKMI